MPDKGGESAGERSDIVFSTNGKISSRQLRRLLVLDFFGKSAVLLPSFAGGMKSREFLLCLILVILMMLVYADLVRRLSEYVGDSFFAYLSERLGKGTALVLVVVFFVYALFTLVYLIEAFGNLGSTFILTEHRAETLMILALLAGMYISLGGGEVRGRVAETLYPVLFYPLVILLVISAFHLQPDDAFEAEARFSGLEPRHMVEMFSVFGGLGFYLFLAPGVDDPGKPDTRRRAGCRRNAGNVCREKTSGRRAHGSLAAGMIQVSAAVLALFVILAGAFGENGISSLSWHAVTLMSSARIPGGFLERWDVIFTGLLMGGLFISTATSIHYLLILGKILFPKAGRGVLAVSFSGTAFALALWCGGKERAAEVYRFVNSYVVVPIWVTMVLLLLCLEKIKGRGRVCGK